MNIKVLSDSTCDLPKELLEAYDITLTPLTVIKDGKEFKDGVTITPAEIFAHVAAGGALCSTSAVSVGEYQEYFSRFAGEYDGVIQVCIGSGFSATYQNACLAAEGFDNVRVVDSRNLTTGQGFVALQACQLAKQAPSLEWIVEQLNDFAGRVEASFVVDKLDYLVKGGRCSSAAALGANLLSLKPCIEVKDNKMVVGKKYRGNLSKCLSHYVQDRLMDREDVDKQTIFVIKTVVSPEAYQVVLDTVNSCGFQNIYRNDAGCTISCHCGPGTLGVIFVRK